MKSALVDLLKLSFEMIIDYILNMQSKLNSCINSKRHNVCLEIWKTKMQKEVGI